MKVKTTYTGCDYITAGKEYEVELLANNLLWINDDDGDSIPIYINGTCLHLDGKASWEIIE